MNKELIKKYLENKCNEKELKQVLDWFVLNGDSPESLEMFWQIWQSDEIKEDAKDIDLEAILDRIHHKVNIVQNVETTGAKEIKINKPRRRELFLRTMRNAAAILLIPLLGISLFYATKYYSVQYCLNKPEMAYNEVFSSVDAVTKVVLPDGTNVWLNHSSSLRYPATFTGHNRDVELRGEGYFEVKHDKSHPFVVKAGSVDVVALGTTFNLMAYPEENKIETSLIEGKIEIQKSADNTVICKMKPMDIAVYNKEKEALLLDIIKDDRYFSWKDGRLVFTAEPFDEVAKKLSRWFNVDIDISDPKVKELTLTAKFENENLAQVLELLSMVSPVNYTVSERKINSDGTFTRRHITLSYRNKQNHIK